ncbi:MAG: serine protease [Syntrophobacteraceae bacterium]
MLHPRSFRLSVLMALMLWPGIASAQYADAKLDIAQINQSVYEVIVPKPQQDSLSYEKPLPMDQVPFQIRNDQYYPIGTAFACSKNELVTAAHVMNLKARSQFREIFVRDAKGNVLSVDRIVKFSSRRDLVVFTVKDRPSSGYLEANLTPAVGGQVYAVGNALGQGIVIRDGLHTSNTPEEVEGKWNWIRFSAAASPGNSGGPLLDKEGRVVGLVVSKSENENLNYALPIAEVFNIDSNNAEIFEKGTHMLEIFDFTKTERLNTQVKLPMDYNDFRESYIKLFNEFNSNMRNALIDENKQNIFPNGTGSNKIMYLGSGSPFPQLIMRNGSGIWEPTQPRNINKADLDNNGRIIHGILKITQYAKIERPDNIALKDLISDSKAFMDLFLKASTMTRTIGPEKIRITSLGKADQELTHIDRYGRKWLLKTWNIEYCDEVVALFMLPVPGGCLVMSKIGQTGETLDDHVEDLKILADFVNFSYAGTLEEWREFLQMSDVVPTVFASMQLELEDSSFRYSSKRFQVRCDPTVMKINAKTFLMLGMGYFRDGEDLVWDTNKLILTEGKFEKTGVAVSRNIKPLDNNEEYGDVWRRIKEGSKPFDKQISIKDDFTGVSTTYRTEDAAASTDPDVLYTVLHTKRGVIDQTEMDLGLDAFLKNVVVFER